MKRKIYLAGKITGNPNYRYMFAQAAFDLEARGFSVLIPSVLPEGMSKADYMRVCFAMIDTADEVIFLPGWRDSPGARLERSYCLYIDKPIRKEYP